MKKKVGAALAVFVPKGDGGDDGDETEASDETNDEGGDDLDTLLGNAFDSYEDGDRKGFIKSMKAALRSA